MNKPHIDMCDRCGRKILLFGDRPITAFGELKAYCPDCMEIRKEVQEKEGNPS